MAKSEKIFKIWIWRKSEYFLKMNDAWIDSNFDPQIVSTQTPLVSQKTFQNFSPLSACRICKMSGYAVSIVSTRKERDRKMSLRPLQMEIPAFMTISTSWFIDQSPYHIKNLIATAKGSKYQSKQLVANIATAEKWLKNLGW